MPCPICGADVDNPEHPAHLNSQRHQDAIGNIKDDLQESVDDGIEAIKLTTPAELEEQKIEKITELINNFPITQLQKEHIIEHLYVEYIFYDAYTQEFLEKAVELLK